MLRSFQIFCVVANLLACPATAQAQCDPRWSDQFQGAWLDAPPTCFAVYDRDGDGPAPPVLVAAGEFKYMNVPGNGFGNRGTPVNHIAQWDGTQWQPMASGLLAADPSTTTVRAMTVWDTDGSGPELPCLYVAGYFKIPGQTANVTVAQWDGAQWTDISPRESFFGGPLNLLTYDIDGSGPMQSRLYGFGRFQTQLLDFKYPFQYPSHFRSFGLAFLAAGRWKPIQCEPIFDYEWFKTAVAVFDPDGNGPARPMLCAVNRSPTNNLEYALGAWEGISFQQLGVFDGRPSSMTSFDEDGDGPRPPRLFVVGQFTHVNQVDARYVAAWDGSQWSAVQGPPNTPSPYLPSQSVVFRVPGEAHDSLFLESFGGGLLKWDGRSWSNTDPNSNYGHQPLIVFDEDGDGPIKPAIIAAGAAPPFGVGMYSKWNGVDWKPIVGGGLESINSASAAAEVYFMMQIESEHEPDGHELLVAGQFFSAGDVPVNRVAALGNSGWSRFDLGKLADPTAGTEFDADGDGPSRANLILAGYLRDSPFPISIVERINGQWITIGDVEGTPEPIITSMVTFDKDGDGPGMPELYVCGSFSAIDGVPANSIAKWDGASWSAVGTQETEGMPKQLAIFDEDGAGPLPPRLFAVGDWHELRLGGFSMIARWDGAAWTRVGDAVIESAWAIQVADSHLTPTGRLGVFVAGSFVHEGAIDGTQEIGVWDGQAWSFLSTGFNDYWSPQRLVRWDEDGDGPQPSQLFITGIFPHVSGVQPIGYFWNGSSMQGLTGLRNSFIHTMCVFDDDGAGPNPPGLFFGGWQLATREFASCGIARYGRPAPFVRRQPEPQCAALSDTTGFTIRAGGQGPFTYQWTKDGVPLSDDGRITGTQTESLRIAGVHPTDAGDYRAIATGACGTTTSRAARLTLEPKAPASPNATLGGN